MNYLDNYKKWCNSGLPKDIEKELDSIKNNEEELKSRFGCEWQRYC